MTRPPKYAVLVITGGCGHPVDVQLTGDAVQNQIRVEHAQQCTCSCPQCRVPVPTSTREE
jgi:hypothetical protein